MSYTVKDLDKVHQERSRIKKALAKAQSEQYNNDLSYKIIWKAMGYCKVCKSNSQTEPVYNYGEIYAVKCGACNSNWALENQK